MKTLATTVDHATGVARVRLNRPEVFNAFDEAMIGELAEAFGALGPDPAVRAIVLEGEGKAFCAGADLRWMMRASEASQEGSLADARRFAQMLAGIAECPKPTLARVHGAALGGGVGLVCACDIALASEAATFAVSEARFGILPAVIGPYLVEAVGARQARRLALTASRFGAAEALALGLIHRVAPPDGLDAALAEILRDLLLGGPGSHREIKALIGRLGARRIDAEVQDLTAATIARVRQTDEAREGFAAFLEKRPPRWAPPKAP
jgi:methylglutaconyl-CoA hydratase